MRIRTVLAVSGFLLLGLPLALGEETAPRKDLNGDPLPPGAVARMRGVGSAGLAIYSVAFSPDGKLLASGSSDGTALIWSAR